MRKQKNNLLRVAAGAVALVATAAFFVPSAQQPSNWKDEYDAFKRDTRKEYDDFRAKANAEYADFMRKAWKEYPQHEPIVIHIEKKTPPPADDKKEPEAIKVVPTVVLDAPTPKPRPMPISRIKGVPSPVPVVVPRHAQAPGAIDAKKGQISPLDYSAPTDPSLANANLPQHSKTPELVVTVIPEPNPFDFVPAAEPSLANPNLPKHAQAPVAPDAKKGEAELFGLDALSGELAMANPNLPKHAQAPEAPDVKKGEAELFGLDALSGELAMANPNLPKHAQAPGAPDAKKGELNQLGYNAPQLSKNSLSHTNVPAFAKEPVTNFDFFGREINVRYPGGFALKSLDHNELADAWLLLSEEKYNSTLLDCLQARSEMQLSDWAYILFLKKFAQSATQTRNEAEFLANWLMAQSGYNTRLVHDPAGKEMHMVFNTDYMLYDRDIPFLVVDGKSYYMTEHMDSAAGSRWCICPSFMPNELAVDLAIFNEQIFGEEMSDAHHFEITRPTVLGYDVSVDMGLMDFYATYPRNCINREFMTQWVPYANAPMSSSIREQIYPKLREKLNGLDKFDAASLLNQLVMHGYKYKVDEDVWGTDRVFFSDEMMFYPYNDCEDRAILLSRLVRDLLDLDCCLLHVEGHMMMAIDFGDNKVPEEVSTVDVEGRPYVIGDPCYMNRPLGSLYRSYKNLTKTVMKLNR